MFYQNYRQSDFAVQVAMLPFGIIIALFYIEPEAIGPIFTSLLGWVFLGVILVMEVLGGLMIRKIVNIDV